MNKINKILERIIVINNLVNKSNPNKLILKLNISNFYSLATDEHIKKSILSALASFEIVIPCERIVIACLFSVHYIIECRII